MKELNTENFELSIQNSPLSFVVFTAPWCGPCKVLKPKIPGLVASSGKDISTYYVDLEENMSLASKYNISAVPYVATFKNGTLIESLATSSQQKISEMLDSL